MCTRSYYKSYDTKFVHVGDAKSAPKIIIIIWPSEHYSLRHYCSNKASASFFLPLTYPQLRVCIGWGITENGISPLIYMMDLVLTQSHCWKLANTQFSYQQALESDQTTFYATFGSLWAARAFKEWSVLSGVWVNMSRTHVLAASCIKSFWMAGKLNLWKAISSDIVMFAKSTVMIKKSQSRSLCWMLLVKLQCPMLDPRHADEDSWKVRSTFFFYL